MIAPTSVFALLVILSLSQEQPSCHAAKFAVSAGASSCRVPAGSLLKSWGGDNTAFLKRTALLRGGDQEDVLTLDEKVKKAMSKLGLTPPTDESENQADSKQDNCKDGVCAIPGSNEASAKEQQQLRPTATSGDIEVLGQRLAEEMNVHSSLAMAALGATSTEDDSNSGKRKYNLDVARTMIQQELDVIKNVAENSDEVKQLVSDGYDSFLARRALAFAEMNMDDARAILLADKMDEEEAEEAAASAAASAEAEPEEMKTITVDADFDPTSIGMKSNAAPAPSPTSMPKAAKKEDVVFEATACQVQELVLESPVPVLLDVYADWCGPCKVLGPILEDMAVKAGGVFRLVKINSDNERAISAALGVTALPTIFGVKNGKIVHMFQGMPKSEEFMKNFMMGLLMPGSSFNPPVTVEQKANYDEITTKLAKTAGGAAFTFAAREVLQDRIAARLDELVKVQNGDLVDTEESVQVLRSLLSNIVANPLETKFRKVNLANKVIAAKVAKFKPCIAILKSVGFAQAGSDTLVVGKGKSFLNVAPLSVARDQLDKWIDQTRYDVAKAARKRKDELELKRLEEEGAFDEEYDDEEDEEEVAVDPSECELKVRMEGKKKVHEVVLDADSPLEKIMENVPAISNLNEEMQITCVAKRLVVKSSDKSAMRKSLRDHGLYPAAALVVKVGKGGEKMSAEVKTSLSARAASEKKKKKGSHTMQSIGIYAKDDNAKGELIDGGGGTLFEHDVTDSEDEAEEATRQTEEEQPEEAEEDQSPDDQ